MEVFTADDFPEQIAPSPATTTDLLTYDNLTAIIPSPSQSQEVKNYAQKLRPIRCNGKNLMEYSNSTPVDIEAAAAAGDIQQLGKGEKSNTTSNIKSGSSSSDLGESGFLNHGHQLYELGDVHLDGTEFLQPETTPDVVTQMLAVAGLGTKRVSEIVSSLASEYNGDSWKDIREPVHRTKKRRSRKKLEFFLENLVARVMQKQEELHNQLIEMIEMKERERVMREEAWKQQEIEWAKKEEQIRAQETSRTLALISYIQNVLGHEIQFSAQLQNSLAKEEKGVVHCQRDMLNDDSDADEKCPSYNEQRKDDIKNGRLPKALARTLSNQRWPESEVKALVALRAALDHKFRGLGSKGSIWEEISVGLSNMGYCRTAKKCKEKWENMNKYFKRIMSNGNTRPENAKKRPYFQELEILCKQGLIRPWNACSSTSEGNEDKGAET